MARVSVRADFVRIKEGRMSLSLLEECACTCFMLDYCGVTVVFRFSTCCGFRFKCHTGAGEARAKVVLGEVVDCIRSSERSMPLPLLSYLCCMRCIDNASGVVGDRCSQYVQLRTNTGGVVNSPFRGWTPTITNPTSPGVVLHAASARHLSLTLFQPRHYDTTTDDTTVISPIHSFHTYTP